MTVTTWQPLPGRALRYTASVAVSVLPSPVRISAILPSLRTIAPMSCTSKWRMPSTRTEASRTTAKASGRSSSVVAPLAMRSRNSCVLAFNSSSESACMAGSSLLMASHLRRYCLIRRSLRLPKIFVRSSSNIVCNQNGSEGTDGTICGMAAPLTPALFRATLFSVAPEPPPCWKGVRSAPPQAPTCIAVGLSHRIPPPDLYLRAIL